MNLPERYHPLLAFFAGILVVIAIDQFIFTPPQDVHDHSSHTHENDEVHVHSDFLIHINGETLDLTNDRFMSSAEQVLHDDAHLHDNEDEVLHRHAEGITFISMLESLGFVVEADCISVPDGETYCSDDTNELQLYVNGSEADLFEYVNQEEDQVLLYFGPADESAVEALQAEITDRSCIYSGTCPERGVAPPESCGLTCEL